jgi:hypothetical protein
VEAISVLVLTQAAPVAARPGSPRVSGFAHRATKTLSSGEEIAMALMLGKLYDALRAAGVPEDKAREAAEEVATFEKDLAEIKSDVRVLKWITGTTLAGVLALVIRTFTS